MTGERLWASYNCRKDIHPLPNALPAVRRSNSLYPVKYSASSRAPHPHFGIPGPVATAAQRRDQRRHRLQIMDGAEFVDVRQHGTDAARARLEAFEAQQRIEPD